MRVACALITHFRAKTELRRRPDLSGRPVAIVDRQRPGSPVVDRSQRSHGMSAGMTLQQAMSMHPELVALDADEEHYRSTFDRMLDAMGRMSDRVESADPGTAYVRLDGLEGLYGGEAGAVSALMSSVPRWFNPRFGVADSKLPALAAASTVGPHRAARAPADVAAFLSPLPVDMLPVPAEMRATLRGFGMRLMGDVAAVGRAAMADRFGSDGPVAWELSHGVDRSPFVPLKQERPVVKHTALPFASTSMEILTVGLDLLLRRGYSRPQLLNRSAAAAVLRCSVSGQEPWTLNARFREPVGGWERASEILGDRMNASPPHAPVNDLTLSLSEISWERGFQAGLLPDARDGGQHRLVELDRRLRCRMDGTPALYRVVETDPAHPLPETRALRIPIDPLNGDSVGPLHTPSPVSVHEGETHTPLAVRLDERWRRVVDTEDTWTVDLWWLPQPVRRTYFRVVESGGRCLTLFRDRGDGSWYRQAGQGRT